MFSQPRSIFFSLFVVFVGGVGGIFGAEPQVLDLPALKRLLLERNAEYRAKKNLKEISGNDFVSAKSQLFWPGVSIKLGNEEEFGSLKALNFRSTPYFGNNNNYLGQLDTSAVKLVGTVLLEEKLPFDSVLTGYLSSDLNFWGGITNVFSGGLIWRQPLIPFFRRSEIDFNRLLSERENRFQKDSLSQKERDLLNQLESLYYDLALIRGSLRVSESKRVKSKQNLLDTKKKLQAGLINEVDALRINLNDNDIQNGNDNLIQSENDKKFEILGLLRMEPLTSVEIRTEDPLSKGGDLIEAEVGYDIELSLRQSLSNENLIREKNFDIWKLDEKYKEEKEKYGLTGDVTLRLGTDFTQYTNYNFSVAINLKTPILDRGDFSRFRTNYILKRDTLLREKEQLAVNLKKDIQQKISDLLDVAREFRLAKENRDFAAKIYAIDQRRFELGLIASDILIKTESDYFSREVELIRQAVLWIKAQNYLEYRYHMVKKK